MVKNGVLSLEHVEASDVHLSLNFVDDTDE